MQQSASARGAAIALARAQLSMLAAQAKTREMVAEAARMRSAGGTAPSNAPIAMSGSQLLLVLRSDAMRLFPRLSGQKRRLVTINYLM